MTNAATLMTPKARDQLQKQERSASVVGFEEAVVDFFVDAADLLGVPKSVAVLYGIVFASAQPLSFADIEARLKAAGARFEVIFAWWLARRAPVDTAVHGLNFALWVLLPLLLWGQTYRHLREKELT